MPFVRLTLNAPDLPQATVDELAGSITQLLAEDLDKLARITVMQVELVPEQSWFIGAKPVTGVGGNMQVSLSSGINTDKEKAAFIDHAYAALGRILGPLAEIFYIEVHEIPGKSWGYNGLPQADRTEDVD